MTEPTEDDFRLTDDHGFQPALGWTWRGSPTAEWEPACGFRWPWGVPRWKYCGLPERYHRMRVIQGPILVRK